MKLSEQEKHQKMLKYRINAIRNIAPLKSF